MADSPFDRAVKREKARRMREAVRDADLTDIEQDYGEFPFGLADIDFLTGAGEFLSDRIPGLRSEIRAPDTLRANLGRMATPLAASFALPGAGTVGVLSQGALAMGLEALDPTSTGTDIATAGMFAGAGTFVGDVGGRALKGAGTRMADRLWQRLGQSDEILRSQSQGMRTVAETLGGTRGIDQANQLKINRAWVKAIGESGDDYGRSVRAKAATRIGKELDRALPDSPIDGSGVRAAIEAIPDNVPINKARMLALVDKAEKDPRAFQELTANIRRQNEALWKTDFRVFSDDVTDVLDAAYEAGQEAGALNTKVAREQYKNLSLLESINAARRGKNVPVIGAENRIASQYSKAVERGTKRSGLTTETQEAISLTQDAAEEIAERFRSSGTSERLIQAEIAGAGVDLLTGAADPGMALRAFGKLGFGQAAANASLAQPAPIFGRLGAAGAGYAQDTVTGRRGRNARNR